MVFLTASLAAFTIAAALGLVLAIDLFKGIPTQRSFTLTHAGMAVLGAVLAIGAALTGDTRVYINIALVVVIVVLGVMAAIKRHKTGVVPKGLIAAHAGIAVICYLILAATVFGVNVIG